MKNKRKANARHIGSKTDLTGNEMQAFSSNDYNEKLESIQSILERMMRPAKIVRCYRCLGCDRNYSASRMSNLLVICRECSRSLNDKGRIAKINQVERIKNKIGIFLKGRLGSV